MRIQVTGSETAMPQNPVLTLYYREGCHLCEQMAASLYGLQGELGFSVQPVDIDDDPELLRKYDVDVPVVTLRNKELFHHFFDEAKLRAAF
jgi:thiol-disulfide isomerase/thioredoxin